MKKNVFQVAVPLALRTLSWPSIYMRYIGHAKQR